MTPPVSSHRRTVPRIIPRSVRGLIVAIGLGLPAMVSGAAPGPLVDLGFTESPGATTAANVGSLGGVGYYWDGDGSGYPMLSSSVPQGTFAPLSNARSLDLGTIGAGQGDRAVDLSTALGPFGTLGRFDSFTLCGWVNARDLNTGWGGNRILFALETPNGSGFDLVQLGDGSLQLGVNQWPDGTPALSSPGLLTADPSVGADNWRFVAVTYDGLGDAGNVSFYAGNANQAAQLDSTRDYPRGPILQSGALTVGNFGGVVGARDETGPGGGSRVLRGLIDEIQVFNRGLGLAEIQEAQLAAVSVNVDAPRLEVASPSAGMVALAWETTGTFQLQVRDDLAGEGWQAVTTAPVIDGDRWTVTLSAGAAAQFYRLRSE